MFEEQEETQEIIRKVMVASLDLEIIRKMMVASLDLSNLLASMNIMEELYRKVKVKEKPKFGLLRNCAMRVKDSYPFVI